jgi:hypothetical protein
VVERCRLAIRTSGFVQAAGKLEHREGTTNVVVSWIERLERPDLPPSRPRHIAPASDRLRYRAPSHQRETGREWGHRIPIEGADAAGGLSKRSFDGVREAAMAELAASLPAPHSFGRRGR